VHGSDRSVATVTLLASVRSVPAIGVVRLVVATDDAEDPQFQWSRAASA
jgi:hypothetical protein